MGGDTADAPQLEPHGGSSRRYAVLTGVISLRGGLRHRSPREVKTLDVVVADGAEHAFFFVTATVTDLPERGLDAERRDLAFTEANSNATLRWRLMQTTFAIGTPSEWMLRAPVR